MDKQMGIADCSVKLPLKVGRFFRNMANTITAAVPKNSLAVKKEGLT